MAKAKKTNYQSQLIEDVSSYDVSRMIFSDPVIGNIPSADPKLPPIKYRRINISTLYDDGSMGDLILKTPADRFSYGVQENLDPQSKKLNGYQMGILLYDMNGATPEQEAWVQTFNSIAQRCKEYLLQDDVKESIEQYELQEAHLYKLNPLYWKREKGKIIPGTGPTLYAKLITGKRKDNDPTPGLRVITRFYNENSDEIDPLTMKDKRCYLTAGIRIESIYIGAGKITLQIKIYEAIVREAQSNMRPLLARPKAAPKFITGQGSNLNELKEDGEELTLTVTADEIPANTPPRPAQAVATPAPAAPVAKTVRPKKKAGAPQ